MSRLRCYISGPISKGDLAHNINQATDAFMKLANAGLAPFNPMLSCFSGGCRTVDVDGWIEVRAKATVGDTSELSHADWLHIDLPWVAVSDVLFRLPGDSVGADMEVLHAHQLGIPVFDDSDKLIAWSRRSKFAE